MAPCTITAETLARFRDGVLSESELRAVQDHLAPGCARCSNRLADASALDSVFGSLTSRWDGELPPDFSARILSVLPVLVAPVSPGARLRAFVKAHTEALVFSLLGAAAAAVLAVVFAPGLQSQGDRAESSAENEAQLHRLEVTSPDENALVLQSAEGNTVIWVVPHAEDDADGGGGVPAP